jgi:hypothetical protein
LRSGGNQAHNQQLQQGAQELLAGAANALHEGA